MHQAKILTDAAEMARLRISDAAAWEEAGFDEVALALYRAQRAAIPVYDQWCAHELRTRGGGEPSHWREIPALPIAAFKQLDVHAHLPAEHTWRSSGTSTNERSRHELHSVELYELSLDAGVRAALVPDVAAGERAPLRCVQLQPSAADGATQSSLTHMFDRIRRGAWCVDGHTFVDAEYRLDADGAWRALATAAGRGEAVLLLATSFALAMLFEDAAARGRAPLTLPAGSRVVDTGGYKGRARELTRDELVAEIEHWLGVPAEWCENEYGMSELSSQAWLGTVAAATGHALPAAPRWFPPWLRVRVVDPVTLVDVADGETGLLVFHDLANVWSCAAIRSEDLGVRRGDSFDVVGRAPGAALKGCSLQLESLA